MAEIAALLGDPARLNILFCLANSDTATAGDLALVANVAPSTTSEHLQKLLDGGLVDVRKVGRQRYYTLSRPEVAQLLEGVDSVANLVSPGGHPDLGRSEAMLHARSCGDHLAGRVGVALTEAILARGWMAQSEDGLVISPEGKRALDDIGVPCGRLEAKPRKLVALCHDWSENAFHLGGAVGGALFQAMKSQDWIRHRRGEIKVQITPKGYAGIRSFLGIELRTA